VTIKTTMVKHWLNVPRAELIAVEVFRRWGVECSTREEAVDYAYKRLAVLIGEHNIKEQGK